MGCPYIINAVGKMVVRNAEDIESRQIIQNLNWGVVVSIVIMFYASFLNVDSWL